MKAKYLFLLFLACWFGYIFYNYLFHEYNDTTIPISVTSKELYFLQYGAYSSYENMQKAVMPLSDYTYISDDKYYYAFVCITADYENMLKVKDYYKSIGYNLYSKQIEVTSSSFLESLSQYDLLLSETSEEQTIPTICSQGLLSYEEEVKVED